MPLHFLFFVHDSYCDDFFVWFVMNIDFWTISTFGTLICDKLFQSRKVGGDDPEATYQLWWFVNSLKSFLCYY
uniref:Uncharacterized protein n=1 Tax=Klebsiella pneumoniae TaxID=573 RepID=A0A8B0STK0_KLEPN|nr:hypothetical protein [Klebsiella pneumoniae]